MDTTLDRKGIIVPCHCLNLSSLELLHPLPKAVLRMWMKEDPLLPAAATPVADLLKQKLDNVVLDRNAAHRELSKITDRSARSFERMLDKEQSPLSENDIEFIANSAAAVLEQTDLTPELLAENDLDPETLAEFYLARPGSEGGNPELANSDDPAKQQLFRSFLLNAATQIVDISSRLPLFTERIFREILRRENRIYEAAERVFDGMDQLLAAQKGDNLEAEKYETAFRQANIRRHDHLQLFGVDLDQSNKRYKLNVAYVTLQIERTAFADEEEDESAAVPDDPDPGGSRIPGSRARQCGPQQVTPTADPRARRCRENDTPSVDHGVLRRACPRRRSDSL